MNFLCQLTGSFAQPAAENSTVAIVEAAYRHHGLPWRYINCEVAPADLGDAVRGARAMRWAGFNCSLPHKVAVIARVPFDEGSLTGALTAGSAWPEGDFRNTYFSRDNLTATLPRVERLRPLVPEGMDLPELALRFILAHPAVTTTIPGMRKMSHVERNLDAADGDPLPHRLRDALRQHRWDRSVVIS